MDSNATSREQIVLDLLKSAEYQQRVADNEFVPPGHFYSVVPSRQVRDRYAGPRQLATDVLGIDMHEDDQLALLRSFKRFHDECPFPSKQSPGHRFFFENQNYSYGDAITLYSMMRHFRPKRIIEIGCGYSSCAMLDTADAHFSGDIEFTFIEPHPALFESLVELESRRHRLISQPVQDVTPSVFDNLSENDILFVDSTHVSKLSSDVNHLLFNVFPRLASGVVIHIHDIFWPFEYPREWIREGRAWNEAYLLRAFLQFNRAFHVLFFSTFLMARHYDYFRRHLPLFLKCCGGSIWLQRT